MAARLRQEIEVRYTLALVNQGNSAGTNVTVRDPLPPELVDVITLDGGVVVGQQISWPSRDRLEVGAEPLIYQFEATIRRDLLSGAVIANQAQVLSDGIDPVNSDDPATPEPLDPTQLTITAEADLSNSIKLVEPPNPEPGDVVTWVIQVVNSGTVDAREVNVLDPLPTNFILDANTDTGEIVNGTLRASLGVIPAGGARSVIVTARLRDGLADGTGVANQAEISAAGLDVVLTDDPSTQADDDPTALVVNATPQLVMTKFTDGLAADSVEPGQRIDYVIRIANVGSGRADDVVVGDPIPEDTTLSDVGAGQLDGDAVEWQLLDIAPGEEAELRMSVLVDDVLDNGMISNQASLSAPF